MLKPVTIMTGPYDTPEAYDVEHGYLVAPDHALYVAEAGDIWFLRVVPSDKPGVMVQESDHVKLGEITEQDDGAVILQIAEKLNGMSGLDFVMRYIVPSDFEIEFDLLRD